jgi:hypothetical protein
MSFQILFLGLVKIHTFHTNRRPEKPERNNHYYGGHSSEQSLEHLQFKTRHQAVQEVRKVKANYHLERRIFW